jgi:hypothetical protein
MHIATKLAQEAPVLVVWLVVVGQSIGVPGVPLLHHIPAILSYSRFSASVGIYVQERNFHCSTNIIWASVVIWWPVAAVSWQLMSLVLLLWIYSRSNMSCFLHI